MVITLYKFAKRINSTKQPANTDIYATYSSAVWIEDTDVIHPSIRIMIAADLDITLCNYIRVNDPGHIDIDRYYFVDSWKWSNEGWIAECTVDVLATYKSAIGAKTEYILRSASQYDTDVVDKMYPVKTSCTVDEIPLSNPWTYSISGGCFVIGVISGDAIYGSVRYVAMDYTAFATLCDELLTNTITVGNNYTTTDASFALQKAIVDPLQYIVSAVFIPISYTDIVGTVQTTLRVWDWYVNINNKVIDLNPYSDNSANFTIPKHPATTARGNYLNTNPFTRAELSFPPFGIVDLDTSITATHPYIYLRYSIDYISGEGTLKVYARETAGSAEQALLAEVSSQVGVPIQISQIKNTATGIATGIIAGMANDLSNMLGQGSAFSGIGSVNSITGHLSTTGKNGAFYQLQYTPAAYMYFMDVVPADVADHGRPLMGFRQISNLSGFVQCDTNGVEIPNALGRENEMILSYLREGFFYE